MLWNEGNDGRKQRHWVMRVKEVRQRRWRMWGLRQNLAQNQTGEVGLEDTEGWDRREGKVGKARKDDKPHTQRRRGCLPK